MPDDYLKKLKEVSGRTVEICKKAVIAGASPIADRIRANAEKVMSGEESGEMMSNFGITPPDVDDRGVINVKVGFGDYDSKGVANPLKANVLESGRVSTGGDGRKHKKRNSKEWARAVESGSVMQPKRPFVRPAVRATKKASLEIMEETISNEIDKIMK